ncbi:MAG: type II toxin-antitoxin system HicA family toxin [Planctomycetes bacterium]|nr:type II toxin-antitoxin system HicA family toxin [Planctomycetota bacterium]
MKLRNLQQHLRKHGCVFVRHGAKHDVWTNPRIQAESAVPRHREIPTGTAKAICRELGIPAD